jgi:hypothetical protein
VNAWNTRKIKHRPKRTGETKLQNVARNSEQRLSEGMNRLFTGQWELQADKTSLYTTLQGFFNADFVDGAHSRSGHFQGDIAVFFSDEETLCVQVRGERALGLAV